MCKFAASIVICAAMLFAAREKKFKSQAEYDLYIEVGKDIARNDFTKAAADLETWTRQFPDSDYRDDRQLFYVQTWAGAKQPAKAIDTAGDLIEKDLDAILSGPADVIKLLYTGTIAIQQIATPTPRQLAIGGAAARRLLDYNRKPENLPDDAWAQARAQLQTAARATLLHVAIVPGAQALQKNDCAAAESAMSRALSDYPESAQAAWYAGLSHLCFYKTQPERISPALYELARASAIDPVKGRVDPQWQKSVVDPYLEKIYSQYHGADPEGLKQLKRASASSASLPPGFNIKSQAEILQEKQVEFETRNPQLAMWMKIKAALSDSKGDEYFTSTLKDSAVPQLKGVLVEAKPACRPTQLLVAIPLPDAAAPDAAEIVLELDRPLAGKPEPQTELHWEGVPSAFVQHPFLLTMETERTKIEGLKTVPCSSAPPKKRR